MFDHKIDLIIVKILAAERLVYINGDQTVSSFYDLLMRPAFFHFALASEVMLALSFSGCNLRKIVRFGHGNGEKVDRIDES